MSSPSQSILSRTISIEKSISIEQTNVLSSATFIKKQRDKTLLLFSLNKKIKAVDRKTKRLNYNELNDSNRQRRKEDLNANQISIFKGLQALSIDEELRLIINRAVRTLKLSIIKSQSYQEACRSAD